MFKEIDGVTFSVYQRDELEAFIGSEFLDTYHVDEIEREATTYDEFAGTLVWDVTDDILSDICYRWQHLSVLDDVARDYDGYIVSVGCKAERIGDICEADDYMKISGFVPLDRLEGYTSRDAYEIHETTQGTLLEIHATRKSE